MNSFVDIKKWCIPKTFFYQYISDHKYFCFDFLQKNTTNSILLESELNEGSMFLLYIFYSNTRKVDIVILNNMYLESRKHKR